MTVTLPAPGDRIRIVATIDDPLPPARGAIGTVRAVEPQFVNRDDGKNYKVFVAWDEKYQPAVGCLLVPEDEHAWEVLPNDDE